MALKHIGFLVFMVLLLIAPKMPLCGAYNLPAKSSVSLGIVGLLFWFLVYPKRIPHFAKLNVYCPLFWLILFALYAFIISLYSGKAVSIAYAVQYLLYIVLVTNLMNRYASSFADSKEEYVFKILFLIAVIYSLGIIVSVFTGPIYPHQVSGMFGRWKGLAIQKGVGFAENQNMAGPVVTFFLAACLYLYHGKTMKKWILMTLFLSALLFTLSRGAIFSFVLAMALVFCLDTLEPFIKRGYLKVSALKDIGFVALSGLTAAVVVLATHAIKAHAINKMIPIAILSGFGLHGQNNIVSVDTASRFELWKWGLNNWASGDLFRMIFGGGFRSSMEILSNRGTWEDAHNIYITILSEFGIVGLVLFLASLFCALFRCVHLFLIGKAQCFDKFGLLAVLSLSINNMAGPYFYSPVCISLLIIVFAITLSPEHETIWQKRFGN